MSKLWHKIRWWCGFDIENNKSPIIKSSDNEILGNNKLVISGFIAVVIFILVIGIFSLNFADIIRGGVSFNIPADSEENIDLRRDGEPMPYGGIHMLVFIRMGMKIWLV